LSDSAGRRSIHFVCIQFHPHSKSSAAFGFHQQYIRKLCDIITKWKRQTHSWEFNCRWIGNALFVCYSQICSNSRKTISFNR
jgi:hypothetical protein